MNSSAAGTTESSSEAQVLIHVWLNLIQRYHHLVNNSTTMILNPQPQALTMLNTMTELCARLRQVLSSSSSSSSLPPKVVALPCRAWFRICDTQGILWESSLLSSDKILWVAAQAKVVQHAVGLLQDVMLHVELDEEEWMSYLISMVMVLPSGQQVQSLRSIIYSSVNHASRLDCWIHICRALETCLASRSSSSMTRKQQESLVQALDGALFVRVIDTCTAVILVPQNETGGTHNMVVPSNKSSLLGTDPSLVLAHVQALEAWLRALGGCRQSWIRVFPGTFAALYQRFLNPATKPKLARATLSALTQLLIHTCGGGTSNPQHQQQSPQVLMNHLQQLAKSSSSSNTQSCKETSTRRTTSKKSQDDDAVLESKFLGHVRHTLPLPLMNIVRQLLPTTTMTTPATKVWVEFLHVLLTAPCWHDTSDDDNNKEDNKSSALQTAALDAFVVLNSTNNSGKESSGMREMIRNQLLGEHNKSHGPLVLRQLQVERFTSLLQECKTLCLQQHTPSLLHAKLVLLAGYVSLTQGQRRLQRELKSWILLQDNEQTVFLSTLRHLYQVDFVHWPNCIVRTTISTKYAAGKEREEETRRRPIGPPWRYLTTHETQSAAHHLIRTLVEHVLGVKGFCQWVDQVIANLYQSLKADQSVEWMDASIGSLRVIQQMIVAAKSCFEDSNFMKSIATLTKAILPLITSTEFLDLRKSLTDSDKGQSDSDRSIQKTHTAWYKGTCAWKYTCLDLLVTLETSRRCDPVGLPVCLYPLQEAGMDPCQPIHQLALHLQAALASSLNFPSVAAMLQSCSGGLVSIARVRLRAIPLLRQPTVHKTASLPWVDELTVIVGVACGMLLQIQTLCEDGNALDSNTETFLSNVKSMMVVPLLKHFDHVVIVLPEPTLIHFLNLFRIASQVLNSWLQRVCSSGNNPCTSNDQQATTLEPSWIRALHKFKKAQPDRSVETEKKPCQAPLVTKKDTEFVSSLLARAGHLLSCESLPVQVASCSAIEAGFEFLGAVARSHAAVEETNGAGTAILRHAAEIWPIVSSQLRLTWNLAGGRSFSSSSSALSPSSVIALPFGQGEELMISKGGPGKTSLMVQTTKRNDDTSQSVVFLERLLDLISLLVVQSDDFMASRFRDHVWPVLSDMLHSHSRGSNNKRRGETKLVCAAIRCVSRIYGCRSAGHALALWVPAIAAALVPLVDDPSRNDLVMTAFLEMAQIDYDAVYEALRKLLNGPIHDPNNKLQYQQLMETILNLPEQELW